MAAIQKQNVQFLSRDAERLSAGQSEPDLPLVKQQKDTAEYICEMILQLRDIAKAAKLHNVMIPLEYTYYEAFSAANRSEPPREEAAWVRNLENSLETPGDVSEVPSSLKEGKDEEDY